MQKRLLLFLVILLASFFSANTQPLFKQLSLKQALKKSQQENKLIFIQVISEKCLQCNEVANRGANNKEFQNKLMEHFVPVTIDEFGPDTEELQEIFNVTSLFGTFIIDKDKNPVYRFSKTQSKPETYIKVLDVAISNKKKIEELKDLEAAYFDRSEKNIATLENIIKRKTALNQNTGLLLEEYVNLTPKDSQQTFHFVHFLANQSPVVGTSAYKVLHSNQAFFNKIWFSMPLEKRVFLNQRTTYRSMKIAVMNRDESFAKVVARFASSTYNEAMQKEIYEANMLNYYRGIRETDKYLDLANTHYTKKFEELTNEKIEKIDRERVARALAKAKRDTSIDETGRKVIKTSTGPLQTYLSYAANQMSNTARIFCEIDHSNKYTSNALKWAERSATIYETPNTLDTYARLLYKIGEKDKAIVYEQKAIEVSKKFGAERKEWQTVIDKIKRGEAID